MISDTKNNNFLKKSNNIAVNVPFSVIGDGYRSEVGGLNANAGASACIQSPSW